MKAQLIYTSCIDMDYNEWLLSVQKWVWEYIVSKIKRDEKVKMLYVDKDRMSFWSKSFTHETADESENNKNNYEMVELCGDGFLDAIARQFFSNKYSDMSVSEITEISTYYTSGKIQSELLKKKADPSAIVRIGSGFTMYMYNIGSDIFEAIFGALFAVADSVEPGTGYDVCGNLFSYFYDDYPFNIEVRFGVPKNQVNKILTRFPSTKTKDVPIQRIVAKKGEPAHVTVFISQQHLNIMTMAGIKLTGGIPRDGIIGYGTGSDKDIASDIAYERALDWLKKNGMNVVWSDWVKAALEREIPQIKQYWPNAHQRLLDEGFRDYDVSKSEKMSSKTRKVYILRGIRQNGSRKYLCSVEASLKATDAIAELFKMYGNREPETFKIIYSNT